MFLVDVDIFRKPRKKRVEEMIVEAMGVEVRAVEEMVVKVMAVEAIAIEEIVNVK